MLNYERDYSETNGDQTNAIPAITGSEVIPRINPKLFRERKELGICNRSVAFCHHRCDFGLADLRCRRCAERISSAHWELSGASPRKLARVVAGIGDAGGNLAN